jgi:hypothetical protein
VGARIGADSLDQADTTDKKQTAEGKISLAHLDRNSGAVFGQSTADAAEGSGAAFSRGDPALNPMQNSGLARRSLSSLADSQERVLEAFWEDTRPAAAPQAPQRGLLESLQVAAAALSSEREDIVASQKLAERFAREPTRVSWQPPARRKTGPIRPYMVAAAFMILMSGGLAVYFLQSGAASKRAPDGGLPNAAAIAPAAEEPLDSLLEERDIPTSRSFIPSQPRSAQRALVDQDSGQAAPASDNSGGAAENWTSAVETLRQLAKAKNSSQQMKAAQPDKTQQMLQQLEVWRKANKAQ